MIHAYSWCTPNGEKLHIALEEMNVDYQLHPINITKGEQFSEEYWAINPNNKIPAIVDDEGPDGEPIALMESGAILLYLAQKAGKFVPSEPRVRHRMQQWLFFQVGHIGPMFGQAHHFENYADVEIPYAIKRYARESSRLMKVLDGHLKDSAYLAGTDYTLADMAMFPWVQSGATGVDLKDYPHVLGWSRSIATRPAVQRGMRLLSEHKSDDFDEEARRHLFGGAEGQA